MSSGTSIPIAKLSVGIGVDKGQLNQVGTDVKRKLDETGEKGSKKPLMETLLYGKGGPEGFKDTAERVVIRGVFGRMGRVLASGGFGAFGLLLATHELVSLGRELLSGGGAAQEFAEKVNKGREALREMSAESMKAETALLKVDEKWRTLLSGKIITTPLEKLKRAGVSKDATEAIEQGIKAADEEREAADKALKPYFDPDDKKRNEAVEGETARNKANIDAGGEVYAPRIRARIEEMRMRGEGSKDLDRLLRWAADWKTASTEMAEGMTRETIASQTRRKVDAENSKKQFERRAELGAKMLPKEESSGASATRAKVGSLESFADKIIEMGVGRNESDEIPKSTLDVLKRIEELLKKPAPIKPVVK